MKLARMGDKRVITYFGDMKSCGIFFQNGSANYNDFVDKIIAVADNIPCEETVDLLEKHYFTRSGSRACQAQKVCALSVKKCKKRHLQNV